MGTKVVSGDIECTNALSLNSTCTLVDNVINVVRSIINKILFAVKFNGFSSVALKGHVPKPYSMQTW